MKSVLHAASFAAVSFCALVAIEASPSFASAAPATQVTPDIVLNDPAIINAPLSSEVPLPDEAVAQGSEQSENNLDGTTEPTTLRDLVASIDTSVPLTREEECLAGAIYFEARNESLEGQHAVADVIINRAESGRFRDTLCGVVYQPGQFSFVRGGKMPAVNRASADWREAVAVARIAIAERWESAVPDALFFHATHVSPRWRLKRIGALGNHVFYR